MKKLFSLAALVMYCITTSVFATPSTASPAQAPSTNQVPYDDIKRFTAAYAQIKNLYVNPVSNQKLFNDAIRGMFAGLDPHSAYLDADDYQELKLGTSGKFCGLGLEITSDNGAIKVISPIDDSPAAKAGIQTGDYILSIDKNLTKDMRLSDAMNKMRGPEGSKVTLTVLRPAQKKPIEFHLIRRNIQVKSVKSEMLDPGFGYVRVSQFQSQTGQEFSRALLNLDKQSNGQLRGLIVDLRNNPGGVLEAAVDVADALLDSDRIEKYHDLIVSTKGRLASSTFAIKAKPGDLISGAPLLVLINGGSASASEIVAGALQDYKRGMIVGTPSFGKGSVQTVVPLSSNSGLKLTTALYYTPAGRSIQAKGIQPDIVIDALQITKKANADSILDKIREADLSGHFNAAKSPSGKNVSIENQETLAIKDYQLFEALNLLKALAVVR